MNRADRMRGLLNEYFQPTSLEVLNESHQHHVAPGAETHFRVRVVSDQFEGKSKIQRHQMLYSVMKAELESGLHALVIEAWTPAEQASGQKKIESPPCTHKKA